MGRMGVYLKYMTLGMDMTDFGKRMTVYGKCMTVYGKYIGQSREVLWEVCGKYVNHLE